MRRWNLARLLDRKFIAAHELLRKQHITNMKSSVEESIKEDIALLRASPLIRKDTQIVGLKYEIDTGLLSEAGGDDGDE